MIVGSIYTINGTAYKCTGVEVTPEVTYIGMLNLNTNEQESIECQNDEQLEVEHQNRMKDYAEYMNNNGL